MRRKYSFFRFALSTLVVISYLSIGTINDASGSQIESSTSSYVKEANTSPVSIPLKAPWLAGVTFHMGGVNDGSFYHEFMHQNGDYYALDFNANTGDTQPINDIYVLAAAVADGEVKEAGWSNIGYGYTVVIGHSGGYESRYAHLRKDSLRVKIGDKVNQGTPLGYIGCTGMSDCKEHLHFAMYFCEKDCEGEEGKKNIQSQIPEPIDYRSGFKDGQELTSNNYGVGVEAYTCKNGEDCLPVEEWNRLYHESFTETYMKYGGQTKLFGTSLDYVKKYQNSTNLFQEFGEFRYDPNSPFCSISAALMESNGVVYLLSGPVWERYKAEGGPAGRLGRPLTDTYQWIRESSNSFGLRNDFEKGSIVWTQGGTTEVLDASNSEWKVTFFNSLTTPLLTRYDHTLNISWTPKSMSYPGPIFSTGCFSAVEALRTYDSGFLSKTDLNVAVQGYARVLLDNKEINPTIDSPDFVTVKKFSKLRFTAPEVKVKFWQDDGKFAIIGVDASQSNVLGGSSTDLFNMLDIPQYPQIAYADYTPPTYQDQEIRSTDTVLVFDTSGSMGEPDSSGITKITAAKQAGMQILNIIEAENVALVGSSQVGIASYSTTASVVSGMTTDIVLLKDMISGMSPSGRTAMADGLQAGIDLFSSTFSNKTLILLSDGLPNISLNSGSSQDVDFIKQQVIDLSTQAGQQGVCINTVGFGDPSMGADSIDEDFLTRVASASGCGKFYYATDAIELANVYVELRHTSTGIIQFQQTGQISQDEQVDLGTIQIPDYQDLFLFTLNWPGSKLQPILIDPLGITVDNSYAGISISETSSLISYILNDPIPGNWQLKLFGLDVPEGTTNFNAILSTRLGIIPSPTPEPTQIIIQEPPSGDGGIGLFLLILLLSAAGIAIYVYSRTLKKTREKEVIPNSTGAKIRGEKGEYRETIINIHDGFVIGRGSLSDLKFNDSSISRRHTLFRFSEGTWFIQDLGSGSGTFVNGKKIDGVKLTSGDRISFGSNVFTFLSER